MEFIYYLKIYLLDFEEGTANRWAWLGWLGMYITSVVGTGTVDTDNSSLLSFWLLMFFFSLVLFIKTFKKAVKFRKLTADQFINKFQSTFDLYD